MSVGRRIVPCLDVHEGRVVKGVQFESLRDAGDPTESALRYELEGADEIVFLDISASHEKRNTTLVSVEQTAKALSIPLTVGGGVRSLLDAKQLLNCGADKIGVNTAAVADPSLIDSISNAYGNQVLVLAVDVKRVDGTFRVFTHGGRRDTGIDALAWLSEAESRGAGEILLTSMDRDGTLSGYDLDLIRAASNAVSLPIIASGGVGKIVDFVAAAPFADALLAASVFHDRRISIADVKLELRAAGFPVRALF